MTWRPATESRPPAGAGVPSPGDATPADNYERYFVPAIGAPLAEELVVLAALARPQPGEAGELPGRLAAPDVELVHRGEVVDGERIEVEPGRGRGRPDSRLGVAIGVVISDGGVHRAALPARDPAPDAARRGAARRGAGTSLPMVADLRGRREASCSWPDRMRSSCATCAQAAGGEPGSNIPVWWASTTACTRSRRLSFPRMCVTWVLTVRLADVELLRRSRRSRGRWRSGAESRARGRSARRGPSAASGRGGSRRTARSRAW